MAELWELSAEAVAAGVRTGEFTALAVTEACLSRIERVEPLVGAFLEVRASAARECARQVDEKRRSGREVGPLAGVPVAIKDNLSLAGTALTCGSRILAGYVAPYTATAVERLLTADAVVVGRTNLDEFAMGSSCENSAFQVTRNPWDLSKVPGGSSGGSAAAVAAGCVPLALGSDTGGSIRQPAALCGVVGFKPSFGRVSRHGLVAFGSSLDQIGPLTRTVHDAALAAAVISGADARDTTCAPRPVDFQLEDLEGDCAGMRVGVLREVDLAALAPDSAAEWAANRERLRQAGFQIVEVSIPALRAAIAVYYVVANCEASANLARFDGVRYGRRGSAPDLLGLYMASRSDGFGAEVKRRIMLGTFALSAGYNDAYYGRARGVQETLKRQFEAAFERCDLIATPTSPSGAFAIGELVDDPLTMYLNDTFTVPANLAGLPAISVPSGLDRHGLPLALQLMARPFDEARLLRAARAFERLVGWSVVPGIHGVAGRSVPA